MLKTTSASLNTTDNSRYREAHFTESVQQMAASRKPDKRDRQLGADLARLRRSKRMTQAQVAERLEMSTQQLGKYERGESRMTVGLYRELTRLLAGDEATATGFSEAHQPFDARAEVIIELQRCLTQVRDDVDRCLKVVSQL